MLKTITHQLKEHAPFTMAGAFLGILAMLILRNLPFKTSYTIFYVFHPAHVLLSAFVTASMYRMHSKNNIFKVILVAYIGSIGIATLSDSIIPYLGEAILKMPNKEAHIGFLEEWWVINPLAIIGILAAFFRPTTKVSHSAHIFVSTAASLFHIIMAAAAPLNYLYYAAIFIFLFIAVWVPCCTSDIIFPLLFVKNYSAKCCEKH